MPTTARKTDLEAFEALVLSQQPATVAWTPVTDYSFEARKQIEGIHPQLIKDVFQPSLVMDAGCGAGHLVLMLRALGVKCYGFDKQFPPIIGRKYTKEWRQERESQRRWFQHLSIAKKYFQGGDYAGFSDGRRFNSKYDLVICREVLEHLTILQIRQAVTNLCKLSSRFLYITTRFAKQPQSLLDVDTSDDLDPTHITMLHQDFLRVLFVLEGFKRRADLEAKMDWQHKGRVLVYERAA